MACRAAPAGGSRWGVLSSFLSLPPLPLPLPLFSLFLSLSPAAAAVPAAVRDGTGGLYGAIRGADLAGGWGGGRLRGKPSGGFRTHSENSKQGTPQCWTCTNSRSSFSFGGGGNQMAGYGKDTPGAGGEGARVDVEAYLGIALFRYPPNQEESHRPSKEGVAAREILKKDFSVWKRLVPRKEENAFVLFCAGKKAYDRETVPAGV
eukprot:gene25341-biopygen11990